MEAVGVSGVDEAVDAIPAEEKAGDSAGRVDLLIVIDTEESKEQNRPENPDLKQLQDLYDLMHAEGLESVELENKDVKIRLQRAHHRSSHEPAHSHSRPSHTSHAAPSSPSSAPAESFSGQTITSPLAGVFYRSSSPTSAPYVQEGVVVDSGQTLCIVEAMKVMNEIKAERRCKILKITAENSRPVTAGQTLFQVEPA
jgi:acetyl-CoA carboxylase biotin carboxyl carrier protein